MAFELTMAFITVLGFFLTGTRFVIYNRIVKEREKIIRKVKKDYCRLLKKPNRILANQTKTNFIKDLTGLYKFEVKLKLAERDFIHLFLGLIVLAFSVFIYDLFGLSSLVFVIMGLEIAGIWSFTAFSSLYATAKYIDMYSFGKRPREFVKKMKF